MPQFTARRVGPTTGTRSYLANWDRRPRSWPYRLHARLPVLYQEESSQRLVDRTTIEGVEVSVAALSWTSRRLQRWWFPQPVPSGRAGSDKERWTRQYPCIRVLRKLPVPRRGNAASPTSGRVPAKPRN